MTVISLLFFACACVAAAVYHFLPQRFKIPWLLLVSLGFLLTWSWQFVLSLTVISLLNYWTSFHLPPEQKRKTIWLYSGIGLNLLAIFLFKYNGFYLPALTHLLNSLGMQLSDGLQLLMPIGLSFMAVQWIAYLLDVSNGRLAPQKDLAVFLLLGFYFPRVVAGPVEKAKPFFARLKKPLPVDRALIERSIVLIVTGLMRKLIFADPLMRLIPAQAFTTPANYGGGQLLLWLIGYAFALYNDFAGYTLIVRGVSLWFGIELSNNFNLPYFSRSFSEFWARWHISLSNWLRDYIYMPLSWKIMHSHSRAKFWINMTLPPLITMAVSALWHGASWNMLVWGGLHGLYQIGEHLAQKFHPQGPMNERSPWKQRVNTAVTFIFTLLAWVPFKMPLQVALLYWQSLLHWGKPVLAVSGTTFSQDKLILWGATKFPAFATPLSLNIAFIVILLLALQFDLAQNRKKSETFLQEWPRWAQLIVIVILAAVIVLAASAKNVLPFVYQNF